MTRNEEYAQRLIGIILADIQTLGDEEYLEVLEIIISELKSYHEAKQEEMDEEG